METMAHDCAKDFAGLGLGEGWRWEKGSWWLEAGASADARAFAAKAIACDARFVAITAAERADGAIRLDYQWDMDGQLLSYTVQTREKKIPSIVDLVPAADWAERETREYFAVEFTGRRALAPLMLRSGDPIGILLRDGSAEAGKKQEAAQ